MVRQVVATLSFAALAGCSSLTSAPAPVDGLVEGLTYYLPRRDIQITVTVVAVGNAKTTTFAIDATPAYADRDTKSFVINYRGSLIAKNELGLGVTPDGLLNSDVTTRSTPQLLAALEKLAEIKVNTVQPVDDTRQQCTEVGTYIWVVEIPRVPDIDRSGKKEWIDGDHKSEICGGRFAVTARVKSGTIKTDPSPNPAAVSGVYYRQSVPIRVKVFDDKNQSLAAAIVRSPTLGNLQFLPIERTLFSANSAKVTFAQGEISAVVQDTEGELAELVKLPAGILKAYFAAVGALFDGFAKRDEAKGKALVAETQLDLERQRRIACIAAIEAKQDSLIESLSCRAKN